MQEIYFIFDSLGRSLASENYMAFVLTLLVVSSGVLIPWFLLHGSNKANRLRRLLDALPTSKVRGVFIGLVELKGTVESNNPLVSFIAETPCVWFSYKVEEHWRRVETTTVIENGKPRTRTTVKTGWATVESGGHQQVFFLRDDSGAIKVYPNGADVEALEVASFTCTPAHEAYYGKGPEESIANSTFERRFTEKAIPLGTVVYVVGPSRECKNEVAAEIAANDDGDEYIISTRNEESIRMTKGLKAWGFALLGMAILMCACYLLRSQIPGLADTFGEEWPLWLIAGIVYVAVWFVSWMWTVYNSLVDTRNRVRQGWAQVEVQLQRRHELIPSLCEVVEGYTKHEHEAMFLVARLRRQQSLDDASIKALQEAYPNLKAEPLYSQLMSELSDTETRIAMAREYYNTIATHLNTRLSIVPEGWIGRMFGVKSVELVLASSREVPRVE